MNHPKLGINHQKRKIDETCLKSERGVVPSSGIWPAKVGIHIFSDRKGEIGQIRIGISTRSRMGNAIKFTNHVRYRITSKTTYGGKFTWESLSGPPNIWIPQMTNGYISAGICWNKKWINHPESSQLTGCSRRQWVDPHSFLGQPPSNKFFNGSMFEDLNLLKFRKIP